MVLRVLRIVRTPLTLFALLAVLCYGAWWGWKNVWAPPPPRPAVPCVNQTVHAGQLRSSQVTVNVYNGGRTPGLASTVAAQLRTKGFKTGSVGNTDKAVTRTVIVGTAVHDPEVLLVKSFFSHASVKADKRSDRSVDVLVGDSYGGFISGAKPSIAVKAKTVCLPSGSPSTLGS